MSDKNTKKRFTAVISSWRQIQLQNFTSWDKLASFLQWPEKDKEKVLKKAIFPLNLPFRLAQKAETNTLQDPILKQFLPSLEELSSPSNFSLDPVQDKNFQKAGSKLLHKYRGRALLVTTSACVMNCRFCFRKNFAYEELGKDFSKEIQIIQQDPSLKEIILSGGDPLSLSDASLEKLLQDLDNIPHIQRIRFHSRFPIGIPERIDASFLKILSSLQKQVVFILHVNHPKELDNDIYQAMKSLQKIGIPVLTQSVLLQGVNDSADTLQKLFEDLSDHGIIPYYLHQLDRVQGAAHFEVSEETGKQLMKELSTRISGYSLPRYVKEEPGKPSKTSISFL
ncbi:MAG: KamA family radical SAM protein [Rhabdochlamydiaceae bacterium]|nr:KamA family radical SAM protein [Rhabdochlamydiaceae bacterium]